MEKKLNVYSIIDQKDLCLADDDIKHYLAKIRVSLTKLYFLLSKTFFDSSDSMTNVYSAEKRSFAMHLETHFLFQTSDFTCDVDEDCNKGYCENGECVCLDDYNYKIDCSLYGCKCINIIFLLQFFSNYNKLTRYTRAY